MNSILILDTSYTLNVFKNRGLYTALKYRNLNGFFKKVISVHPLSGLIDKNKLGKHRIDKVTKDHIFVSGKIGSINFLKIFPALNFVISQIELIFLLTKLVKKYKVNVVRIGDPFYLGILGLIISRKFKIPLVLRIGANFDEIAKQKGSAVLKNFFRFRFIEKIVEKFVLTRCDMVISANVNNLKYAQKNGAKKKLSTVVGYGNLINPIHWKSPRKRANKKLINQFGLKNKQFVSIVSRLEKEKFIEQIIKIAAIQKKIFPLKFLIIGDGLEKKNLVNLAKRLDVLEIIKFAGNINQKWIAEILPLSFAAICINGGRSLVEKCLAEIPIIAADYDLNSEIIKNHKNGLLVKFGKLQNFVDKLVFLKKNKKEQKKWQKMLESIY